MKLFASDSNPLLSISEVAEILEVSESTVWRMLRRRELASVRKGGRRLVPGRALEGKVRSKAKEALVPFTAEHAIWRLVGAFRAGGEPGSGDKHAILDQPE